MTHATTASVKPELAIWISTSEGMINMTYGASSPGRSQSETRIKVMLNAEIVVSTEDGASAAANNDYINQQIKQAERDLNACSSGFERIKVEGEI